MDQNRLLRIFAALIIMFLAIFNYVNRAILVPNARYILMDLNGFTEAEANEQLQLITSLHTIFKWTAAAFTILYGYLNDKYPRKLILTIGGLVYGICSIFTMYVNSYNGLVVMQILTAISIGASLPTSYSLLSDMFPVQNRGKVFGVFGVSTILGDILGNLMVSLIFPTTVENLGNWRPPFLICGLISVILTIILYLVVKEPKRGAQEEALKEILTTESIEYSYRIRKEDLKEVWTNKSNFWLILNFIDNIFGGYILATAIDWLRTEHGASPEVAGMLIIIPALAIMSGTIFWGFVGDKWFQKDKAGRVKVCTLCLSVSAPLMILAVSMPFNLTGMDLGQAMADTQFLTAFAIFFVFFFFNNGIGPGWHSTIIDANRVEVRGSMLSVATFFEEFGEGLGILIGGIVHDAFVVAGADTPFGITYQWLSVTMILGVIMWIPLLKNIKADIAKVEALNAERAQTLRK